ncbi:phosphofurin acidic cluster sorting protein 1 isoform X2 [Folsomia candida]|uniref:phosphofurin acidic cluster sorting protein 1 isoform X2 n=1 Tax=Folsomia candida TaxID=158441 RepID=UPI000B90289A|nr:phosphofurin acidic cluster sorting protein 1 isoform X2 [Folsomia candida]
MSEKQNRGGTSHQNASSNPSKPVPMKLFSSWEVDRTPSNCIPRLCSLTLIRLVVIRPLPTTETTSIVIAVKMAGSRRTLRSNEILIPDNGLISTDLELHFSLQYPHFLKREENRLLIMLQRRKKYKNRTILGYKTLAEGSIDMALVLQRSYLDMELSLLAPESGNKENHGPIAKVTIMGIASHPVDEVEGDRKGKGKTRTPALDHAHADFSEDDFSSHSSDDSPQDEVIIRKNSKSHPHNRNLKQKIVNLLKKFKQTEDGHRNEAKIGGPVADIDELFDELEGLSDSEPDADTLSVGSFPKPVLPPFFASSKSLVQYIDTIPEKSIITSDERGDSDSWTEPDQQSGESPKLHMKSPGASPGNISSSTVQSPSVTTSTKNLNLGTISDQLSRVLPPDDGFPDLIVFVSLENNGIGVGIFSALTKYNVKTLGIERIESDLKVAMPHIVGKVQKFCNNNAKPPPPLNIAVVGPDSFLSAVTKHYVTQLSSRPHDWQNYFSFIYAPFSTGGSVWRLLCQSDPQYVQNFNDFTERGNAEELALRIIAFFSVAKERRHIVHLPIAEAMITYKESDESSQVFAPFISEVRLNVGYSLQLTPGDQQQHHPDGEISHLSSSPPSPPHSPRGEEPLELQVDFWKGTAKSSVKAYFRSLSIQRTQDNALSISYVLKEQKKQKIMRLGKKKERESDVKNLTMDGISRLVCLSKSQTPMKLFVDGAEWPGVKFFQVSAQWQSQVKNLPLLVSAHGKNDSG